MVKVIGIAGGSASGKTTIVEMVERFLGSQVFVIPQDAYYEPYANLPLSERIKQNFDHPDAFDMDRLVEDIKRLKAGQAIEMPVYDYVQYTRSDKTITVEPHPVIIVEGVLVLWYEKLRDLLDLSVFVETDADVRLIRRILRDTRERGRTLESILDQYQETVKPMHDQFVAPSRKFADIILPRGGENERGIRILQEHLKSILGPE